MNYRRWLIVAYLLVLMGIAASILLIPGEKYSTLTTSDSGWVYTSAREIDELNGIPENNPISHAPYGLAFEQEQLQPLASVMLYRGVRSIVPGIELMDIVKYWAPLLFALSLIPIFLIGRELGGDLAGCAAAFFATFMISTIYWNKVGAFDREPIQLLIGAWAMFLTIKMFKYKGKEALKLAIPTGMVYGLYALAWAGWHYLIAVLLIGIFALLLHELIARIIRRTRAVNLESVLKEIWSEHGAVFLACVSMTIVITAVMAAYLGRGPDFWADAFRTYFGYLGIGAGGGISFPRYAGEAQAPGSLFQTASDFYSNTAITFIVFSLVALAILKFAWTRKRWEIITLSWLLVLTAMVWPGAGQARFERLGWAFVPAMAGVGVSALVSLIKKESFGDHFPYLKKLYNPILGAAILVLVGLGFASNAYHIAGRTTPPTEWRFVGLDSGFNDAFQWIKENTPENCVVAVEWSFGHLVGGATHRMTVCDGAEVVREEGTWENERSGPLPPDYIYYVDEKEAKMYGINVPRKSYGINGRRTDVQWMPYMEPEEFGWLLKTYRENYGVKIDYILLTYEDYYGAYSYYQSAMPANILLRANRLKTPNRLVPTFQEGSVYRYDFGENREYVMLDTSSNRVYLSAGGENLTMDGYAIMKVNDQGQISDYVGFYPPSEPAAIPETLILFLDQSMNPMTAWLVEGCSSRISGRPIPVGLQVFGTMNGMEYARVVYTSTNGMVKIVEINHSPKLISPADGSEVDENRPRLEWAGALGASIYRVIIDDESDFVSPVLEQEVSARGWMVPSQELTPGTYHWKVIAVYDSGQEEETQTWRFTVSPEGE
ncbi:MAG: STT3 domain-containing protein [Candidatus Hadarchaeales archaeon]